MSRKEIIKHLRQWEKLYFDLDRQRQALVDCLGIDLLESPLMNAIDALWNAYSDEVSEKVGDIKEQGRYVWLDWYETECDMGREPQQAKRNEWKRMRKIGSIEKLAELMA